MSSFEGIETFSRSLRDEGEELARSWLVRALEEDPIEQVAKLQPERVVGELPQLVEQLVRAIEGSGDPPGAGAGLALDRLARFRSRGGSDPAELTRDVARLQSVMVEALGSAVTDPRTKSLLHTIERLAAVLGSSLAERVAEAVAERSRELEEQANTDALTGLYNLRHLRQQLGQLVTVQQRYGRRFGLVMLDIDGLKRINDAFGHPAGDAALVRVGQVLRKQIRSADTPVRLGGDEFCVVAPEQGLERTRVLAERIGVAMQRVDSPDGHGLGVSIGVAACPEHGTDPEALLDLVDQAMYRAKAARRTGAAQRGTRARPGA